MSLFAPIFQSLNEAGARYVVVGGFATVMHGYARLTADIDVIVDLEPAEARRTMEALVGLGLRPRAPVDPLTFADPDVRQGWIDDKGLTVFSFFDPGNPLREVDVFVATPIPFEELWSRSETLEVAGVLVRIACIDDLIRLKEISARSQDLEDIDALRAIKEKRNG